MNKMKQQPGYDKREVVKTTIRLSQALHARVRHKAIDEGTDMQGLIVRALEQYLKGGAR
jgi:predicted DNA binding CopG/RHH family protein